MSIDEAIAHAREVAKEKYTEGMLCHANPDDEKLGECIKCAREHEQLAEWLEELKEYREIGTVEECRNSVLDIPKAYNKGIDDLMEKASECFISDAYWNYLVQVAEQLKAGGENE